MPLSTEIYLRNLEVPSRNVLDKMHWAKRHRFTQMVETMLWPFRPNGWKATGPRSVLIIARRKRKLDRDNLVGGCKGIIDALVRSGYLIDDDEANCSIQFKQELCGKVKPSVSIIITEGITP